MPFKDPEKYKEYRRQYRAKNKDKIAHQQKEYKKEYRQKNREKLAQKEREYKQTPQGKKSQRISKWKQQGIIFFDYDLLYDYYIGTKLCEYCHCELTDGRSATSRCLDHAHDITEYDNVRGVLCRSCNSKDVLSLV